MGTRYVGLGIESSMGAETAPYEFIDVVSESVRGEQNIIYIETAGLGRSIRQAVPGPWGESGDIDLIVGPENIEYILFATLGQVKYYASGDGAYKHVFEPASTIPSFTLEIAPDVGGRARRITMAGVSSLRLEAVAREALTATMSIVAAKEKLVNESTPTFSTKRPFVFYDGVMKIDGGTVARCEAWRGTYENTIADDAYVLGSRFLPTLIVGPCNFSGDMDIQFLDWQYYEKYLGGTEPGKTLQTISIELNFVGESTGSSVSGYDKYMLKIEIPKVTLNTSEASFDRRERIVQSIDWQAIYDPTYGYLCRFTVVNTRLLTLYTSNNFSSKLTIG